MFRTPLVALALALSSPFVACDDPGYGDVIPIAANDTTPPFASPIFFKGMNLMEQTSHIAGPSVGTTAHYGGYGWQGYAYGDARYISVRPGEEAGFAIMGQDFAQGALLQSRNPVQWVYMDYTIRYWCKGSGSSVQKGGTKSAYQPSLSGNAYEYLVASVEFNDVTDCGPAGLAAVHAWFSPDRVIDFAGNTYDYAIEGPRNPDNSLKVNALYATFE